MIDGRGQVQQGEYQRRILSYGSRENLPNPVQNPKGTREKATGFNIQ